MNSKVVNKEQLKDYFYDGMSIMIGGFMANGTPETIVDMIVESKVKDLTLFCNDAGYPDKGIGKIIASGQCKKLYASHIGLNPQAQQLMNEGSMEIVLIPQGTLVEQIRAGGAGLGGILTPTGIGTLVEEGKEIINVDGKDFILEKAFTADLAIIHANMCDKLGNSKLLGTSSNFNPAMSLAGKTVMVETKELVDSIDPNNITIPHVVVDYVIKGEQ